MATFADEYIKLKTVGNEYFLKGDFAKAEEAYSALLLNFDRDRAILFTNRSAARLGLGRQDEALSDAEQAIKLDKKWIKAYYRKASALEALNRCRLSEEDILIAVLLCISLQKGPDTLSSFPIIHTQTKRYI